MPWDKIEKTVREIATAKWNSNAIAEEIAGIQCDCVLKVEQDRWVVIEITENHRLEKIRDDITRLKLIKNALLQKDIYCSCYEVLKKTPTNSMRKTGESQNIRVLSVKEFQNEFFNYSVYIHNRMKKQFGSLINLETGEPENNTYIDVCYKNKKYNKELGIQEIIKFLKKGKKILLKGDFGSGKSRCVKQIFDTMVSEENENIITIAINLRECWGLKRGIEILNRHFCDLGLDEKNFIRVYENSNIIYLLDGFDEIGTQSWSSDPQKMHHIREVSVSALKDLLVHCNGGVLITGREYYFNSDEEMLNCLGLRSDKVISLDCHSEFTERELIDFMNRNMPNECRNENLLELPSWFPKRPLVMQLLLKYADDIFFIDHVMDDICAFWFEFMTKICEREANIYPALNPLTIRDVLILLANKTRNGSSNTGPITQRDLARAFTDVTGLQPTDESTIMLQRLPTLGRVSADSPDRQFLDNFILDALRAEGIIQHSKNINEAIYREKWQQPMSVTGCSILATYISRDEKNFDLFLNIARRAADMSNGILAADIVASMCLLDKQNIDFKNIYISDCTIMDLKFNGKVISKLTIQNSVIERMDIANSKFDESVLIENCIINTVFGIASNQSVPKQICNCSIEHFEKLSTTTRVKKAKLSDSQKIFIETIRKIFFQPGAGRKEEALHRGMGNLTNKNLNKKILNKLLEEGVITRHKGDEGYVYKPVRKYAKRMEKIINDLTLSDDNLWKVITEMNSST
ncbi:MAG: hypothetical protein IKN43_02915 [Selenomonadaceae bacterium]|nr:hypothetical protein [Selenomonadaceae bacterium]